MHPCMSTYILSIQIIGGKGEQYWKELVALSFCPLIQPDVLRFSVIPNLVPFSRYHNPTIRVYNCT